MEILQAKKMALELMQEYHLIERGWTLKFDRAVLRFGLCRHSKRLISISRPLTIANNEAEVRDTILHEMAHAIVGRGHGHGPVWKRQALAMGCDGQARYDSRVKEPEKKWLLWCHSCRRVVCQKSRLPKNKRSCGLCCPGRYNEKFLLLVIPNHNYKKL